MDSNSVGKLLASSLLFAIVICIGQAQAAPIFWLQTTDVAGAPAPLQLFGGSNSTGRLYLFGSSDTARVGGISFDLKSSNSASLSFTDFSYGPQNNTAWIFHGLAGVTPSAVKNIEGFSINGFGGEGFGPGSSLGNTLLLGSVGYSFGSNLTQTPLSLNVGEGSVSDYDGNFLSFHVGSAQSPLVSGETVGAGATIGTTNQCLCGISVSGQAFRYANPGSPGFVDYTFTYFADLPAPGPVSWSNFDGAYYVGPYHLNRDDIKPATFDTSTGKFHWDTTGAAAGSYYWFVSASAQGYYGQGMLWVDIIPEPTSAALFLLGSLGFVWFRRR